MPTTQLQTIIYLRPFLLISIRNLLDHVCWHLFFGLAYFMSHVCLKRMCVLLLMKMFCRCLSSWLAVLFKPCISLLIFLLVVISHYWEWDINVSKYDFELPISPFSSVSFCFKYLGVLVVKCLLYTCLSS